MRLLLDQLENSLDSRSYYLSLFMALTIPDMAGAMDSDSGQATRPQFVDWFETWVRPRFGENRNKRLALEDQPGVHRENPLDGHSCYLFRCSLLHQGRAIHPKSNFARIMFVEPDQGARVHYGILDDALVIDVNEFCREIIQGARMWLNTVENTDRYNLHYSNFARRHPRGIAPYIRGIPVIG